MNLLPAAGLVWIEAGGLDQLDATEKVALWRRFETFRNRLPLIDHSLIADAEATDLAGSHCASSLTGFLVQVLQLSPGEAASRVRAAAAVGPRMSMLGEQLEQVLPRLAALQRQGAVSTEKVQIVERAMQKLSRPDLHPQAVDTAEELLTQYAPILGPTDLRRSSRGQTMALITRDAGCSFPGCTHPPSWCDRHHILDWILGGLTDLDNLSLLCRYHHTHFLQKGWTCHINTDGLPEWIPPWWIDQQQRPQINTRIRRLHTQRQQHPRRRRRTPDAA